MVFPWNRIFSNIINVFIVTYDQFNASLLSKSINFFKKNSFDFWTVYMTFIKL